MKVRAALVAGVVLVGTFAGTGLAATKKVCNLVTDPKGDNKYNNVPGDAAVDVVSGDLASNKTQITAVIRLDKLTKPDPQAPAGMQWVFGFVPKGLTDADLLYVAALTSPKGDEFFLGHQAPDPNTEVPTTYKDADAKGTLDVAKNEIRITATIKDFGAYAPLIAAGKTLSGLTIEARRIYGQRFVPSQTAGPVRVPLGGISTTWDTAKGTKSYIAGALSCLLVGK